MESFSESFESNTAANAMCMNPCTASLLSLYSTFASGLPNTEGCARTKTVMRMMTSMVGGVICAKNHLNWRCGAVFGNFATIGSEAVAGSGAGSVALQGSGSAPATIFGIALTQEQRSEFHGVCGQFQAAGCCMSTMVAVLNNPSFRGMLGDRDSGGGDDSINTAA